MHLQSRVNLNVIFVFFLLQLQYKNIINNDNELKKQKIKTFLYFYKSISSV